MKRKEITEAKQKVREEIKTMLAQISSLQTVPHRILNGNYNQAVEYKDVLELAKNKASCTYQHGTLADLLARKEKVQSWLNAIT